MDKKLKCFISASAKTDTKIIKNILENNGIIAYDFYDFPLGQSIQDIKKKIKEADFGIAVISGNDTNVFYEMGICEGLGKPLLVIIDKDYEAPNYVRNYIHLKTYIEDKQLLKMSILRFADEIFLNKKSLLKKYKKPISYVFKINSTENYFEKIQFIRRSGNELELERLIEEIFNKLNLQIVSNPSENKGADFAIWDDNLYSLIGNPILIEVKYGQLNVQMISNSEKQLQNYVERSGAKAGILFYLDKNSKRFNEDYSLNPLILRFDFEDFIKDISQNSFENVVLKERNKIIHGKIE